MIFHGNAFPCIERAGTINLPLLLFFHEGLNYVNKVVSSVLSVLPVPRGYKSSESKPPIYFTLVFIFPNTNSSLMCVFHYKAQIV